MKKQDEEYSKPILKIKAKMTEKGIDEWDIKPEYLNFLARRDRDLCVANMVDLHTGIWPSELFRHLEYHSGPGIWNQQNFFDCLERLLGKSERNAKFLIEEYHGLRIKPADGRGKPKQLRTTQGGRRLMRSLRHEYSVAENNPNAKANIAELNRQLKIHTEGKETTRDSVVRAYDAYDRIITNRPAIQYCA